MGVDYCFILTFRKERAESVRKVVGEFQFLFPADRFIDMYLRMFYEDIELPPDQLRDLTNEFNVSFREKDDSFVVRFEAYTNTLSVLFADSLSIENELVKFWKANGGTNFEFDGDPYYPIEIVRSDGTVFRTGDRYGEDHRLQKRGEKYVENSCPTLSISSTAIRPLDITYHGRAIYGL